MKWLMVIIELDDGKILTGKPNQFDGKNTMGFRLKFSLKTVSVGHQPVVHYIYPSGLSRESHKLLSLRIIGFTNYPSVIH